MNAERRAQLKKIIVTIQDCANRVERLKDDEENALDGVPENLQESDRYYGMEEAVEFLEAAGEALEEAVDNMENAVAR